MRRQVTRTCAAAASGVLIWASFPPLGWWPAAVVGVAGLAVLVRNTSGRGAVGLGAACGLGLWVPLLSFLRHLGIDAWVAVALIESLWFAALGLALRWSGRLRWWPLADGLLWVAQEFGRDHVPFGGFPWGRLAFGQADGPLVRLAALGGAPLVTFAVALAGGLLGYGLLRAAGRRFIAAAAALVAALGLLALPLAIRLPTAGTSSAGRPSSAVVALVQGNVPRLGLEAFAQRRAVTADHLAETQRLAALVDAGRLPRPDVVIWPENASDSDPYHDPIARSMISEAVAAIGVPVVVGAVLQGPGPDHVRNAAIVWSPRTGPGQVYVKRHLVPFGEYLPFRRVMTALVGKFSMISKDFVPGHRPGVLTVGPVRLADAICFEVADDTVVRQAVVGGGRLVSVQTNNADYEQKGDTGSGGETAQQLAISRLRAVEHGRAVVVVATSGVSAVVAPDGRVTERTGVFTPALIDVRVPLRDPLTVADRVGAWPEWVMAGLGVVALALSLRRRGAAAGQQTGSPSPEPQVSVGV